MDYDVTFPVQKCSSKSKTKDWGKRCVDWAALRTYFNHAGVRKSIVHMKINYDLVNGIIHMDDIAGILNPGNLSTGYIPEKIQHFPIMNSKLNTLRGEEGARVFDWRAIITNPYAIGEIEQEKKRLFDELVASAIEDSEIDNAQAEAQIKDGKKELNTNWQDKREIQCNELLKHYSKEQNFKQIFNDGFMDACICNTEVYQCGIRCGEPFLAKLNPLKLRVFWNGSSNRIEDADLLIYEDYWSRSKIVEIYHDELTEKQVKWLSDEIPNTGMTGIGAEGFEDERGAFLPRTRIVGQEGILIEGDSPLGEIFDAFPELEGGLGSSLLPYDMDGNIRVVQVFWKSFRKILRVKSYDKVTGEVNYDFYPETYIPNEDDGEEADPIWVPQAWQGTKIGEDIYVDIHPCLVQHNSISDPARCHFGIVGTIYNVNESRPYSLVDMMKEYNYLYDAVHAKLVELIATNWGKLVEFDLAMKPKNWQIDKWMYFARRNKVLIKDSFKEGSKGAATGKLAGGLNNATKGYIDADWGNSIQGYINILQWTKDSMSDLVGINRQREGQTYSRETVGGIERAVMQSSYITDWLFLKHDDTKRRALECFIEEAQGSLRGRSKKFEYTLSDGSRQIMEVDGDLFSECSYGIVVDNSNDTQKLYQQIESLAQAGIQNQMLDFSTVMRLYSSLSVNEKIRLVEDAEEKMRARQQQQVEQQNQLEQQKIQADMQAKQAEMQQKAELAQLDSETRIKVAEINSKAEEMRLGIYEAQNNVALRTRELDIEEEKLRQDILQFDKELREKENERKDKKEIELKKIAAQKSRSTTK